MPRRMENSLNELTKIVQQKCMEGLGFKVLKYYNMVLRRQYHGSGNDVYGKLVLKHQLIFDWIDG